MKRVRIGDRLKLALARNPGLRVRGMYRVRVPRGTRCVYLPRKNHYRRDAFTEKDERHLNEVGDLLEPCVVRRGAHGFGWHSCPHHQVYIEERQARLT